MNHYIPTLLINFINHVFITVVIEKFSYFMNRSWLYLFKIVTFVTVTVDMELPKVKQLL